MQRLAWDTFRKIGVLAASKTRFESSLEGQYDSGLQRSLSFLNDFCDNWKRNVLERVYRLIGTMSDARVNYILKLKCSIPH